MAVGGQPGWAPPAGSDHVGPLGGEGGSRRTFRPLSPPTQHTLQHFEISESSIGCSFLRSSGSSGPRTPVLGVSSLSHQQLVFKSAVGGQRWIFLSRGLE